MKKVLKKSLALILALTMLFGAAPLAGLVGIELPSIKEVFADKADAATGTYGVLSYEINNGEVFITDCDTSASGELEIPGSIEGYPVTKIGDWAFEDCTSLTSIIIPDSVTSIGNGAFSETGIYNDESNWENGVLYIGNHLIEAKTTLEGDYTIKSGTKTIADRAFFNCTNLLSITIPKSVTSIGSSAFEACSSLASVTIPDSVKIIGSEAFFWCESLTSITIPDSVKIIGSEAFSCCTSLASITVDEGNLNYSNDEYGVLFNKDKTELVQYPVGNARAKYTIPDSVTGIGYCAFYNCTNLTNITIPDSVTSIGEYAFEHCESLTSITIPNSVTNIGFCAFDGCNNLIDVYYIGAVNEWDVITIHSGNEYLTGATIHYNTSRGYALEKNDIFSFTNSYSNFRTGTYTMTDKDFLKLTNYVKKMYNIVNAKIIINSLQNYRSSSWEGSCYGMATSVILNKTNQINFVKNFNSTAENMYGVSAPYQNSAVQSAINYYHISQNINALRESTYYSGDSDWSAGLKNLVNTVKNGNLTLFSYWWEGESEYYGHTIVLIGYEEAADGGHNLIAYDNRYGSNYINVYIDKNYSTCIVDDTEVPYGIEFKTDFSAFDKIDIDGPNNDMFISNMTYSESVGTQISVVLNGDVTVKNKAGETLTIENGVIGGDMDIISTHMIVNSKADGTPEPVTLVFEVEDSDSFTFESTADEISASLTSDNCYAEVTATADSVIIAEDEGIYTVGDNVEFNGSLSLNNDVCDMISFEGQGDGDVNLLYNESNDIIVEGSTGEGAITVYSETVDMNSANINSEYESLKISGNGSGIAGNVIITASSNNNNIYDITLAEIIKTEKNVNTSIKTPSTTTINYGDSIILHSELDGTLPAGARIEWTADNGNFSMSVAEDGSTCKISPKSSGKTVFTVTVYDKDGNVISTDTQEMTAKAGIWQKIVAFFKKIFGLTKTIPEMFKGISVNY